MLIAAMLAVASNVLLVYALREADLSLLGPINAFKSVVSLVLGVFLIGERPTTAGVAGVLLIVAGSYFVIDKPASQPVGNAFVRFFSERGIQLRFAALFLLRTEAIVLKRAIVAAPSPLAVFVLWCVLGLPIALSPPPWPCYGTIRRASPSAAEISRHLRVSRLHHWHHAARDGPDLPRTAGRIFPRAVSVIRNRQRRSGPPVLGEAHLRERLVGSAFMAAGAALIATQGHR